jgi:hypothetical protein
MRHTVEQVVRDLTRVGVKFSRTEKEADASRMHVVGIKTLGKLDFLNGQGYTVFLPTVDYDPSRGYKGLKNR